jgi:Zinc knuckle
MSAQAANRPQIGGCLKCGEKGHWARDCTAPREKWLSRDVQSQQKNGNTQTANTQDGNTDPTAEDQEK